MSEGEPLAGAVESDIPLEETELANKIHKAASGDGTEVGKQIVALGSVDSVLSSGESTAKPQDEVPSSGLESVGKTVVKSEQPVPQEAVKDEPFEQFELARGKAEERIRGTQTRLKGTELEGAEGQITTDLVEPAARLAVEKQYPQALELLDKVEGRCAELEKLAEDAASYRRVRKETQVEFEQLETCDWHEAIADKIEPIERSLSEADLLATPTQRKYGEAEGRLPTIREDIRAAREKADECQRQYAEAKQQGLERLNLLDSAVASTEFVPDAAEIRTTIYGEAVKAGETSPRDFAKATSLLGQIDAKCRTVEEFNTKAKEYQSKRPGAVSKISTAKLLTWKDVTAVKDLLDELDPLLNDADLKASYAQKAYGPALVIIETTIPQKCEAATLASSSHQNYENWAKELEDNFSSNDAFFKSDDDFKVDWAKLKTDYVDKFRNAVNACNYTTANPFYAPYWTEKQKIVDGWYKRKEYKELLPSAESRVWDLEHKYNPSLAGTMSVPCLAAKTALNEAKSKAGSKDFATAVTQLQEVAKQHALGMGIVAPAMYAYAESAFQSLETSAWLTTDTNKVTVKAFVQAELEKLRGKLAAAETAKNSGVVITAEKVSWEVFNGSNDLLKVAENYAKFLKKVQDEIQIPAAHAAINPHIGLLNTLLAKARKTADKRRFPDADKLLEEVKLGCTAASDFVREYKRVESLVPSDNPALVNELNAIRSRLAAAQTRAQGQDYATAKTLLAEVEQLCTRTTQALSGHSEAKLEIGKNLMDGYAKVVQLVNALENRTPPEIPLYVKGRVDKIKEKLEQAKLALKI